MSVISSPTGRRTRIRVAPSRCSMISGRARLSRSADGIAKTWYDDRADLATDRRHSAVMERGSSSGILARMNLNPLRDSHGPLAAADLIRLASGAPDARVARASYPPNCASEGSDPRNPRRRFGPVSNRCGRRVGDPSVQRPRMMPGGPPHQADRDEYPVYRELPMLYPGPVAGPAEIGIVRDAAQFVW